MSTSATVLILIAVTSPGAMLSGRPSSTSMTYRYCISTC